MSTGADLMQDTKKRVLVYGRSGAGKTSLVGRILEVDEMSPVYVFDFDLRINSLLAVIDHDAIRRNLSYDSYRDGVSPGRAFSDAEAKLRSLAAEIASGNGPKTVGVDSLTFMEKSFMGRILMMDGKQVNSSPKLQHYKSIISQLEDFISKLCALDCNVVVTAHEDVDKDEISGSIVRGIGVTGKKLPTILPGYFNELWYAEVVAGPAGQPAAHRVRVAPTATIAARSVYSNVLAPLEDQQIWKKLVAEDKKRALVHKLRVKQRFSLGTVPAGIVLSVGIQTVNATLGG